jgi:folate-binding protein YgfZ
MTNADMTDTDLFAVDPSRAVIAVEGEDRQTFLQGLISNDTQRVSASLALYSAFLTPQGKFLHEFALVDTAGPDGPRILMAPETERRADLMKRLSMYRLRSKVKIVDLTDWVVVMFWGPGALRRLGLGVERGTARPLGNGVVFTDPRLSALGAVAFLPGVELEAAAAGFAAGEIADYERHRATAGVPGGSRDLIPEKAILLENGFDELGAIDWGKGCYMGQELTARTRYRGLVRKRLLPVEISGAPPAPGTPLMLGEVEAGELRSIAADGKVGLAMIRIEHLDRARSEGLMAGEAKVHPFVPEWMRLPEQVG